MMSVRVILNSACRKTERYDGQESWIVAGPPTLENRGPATYEGGRRWDDSVDVVRWPEDEDYLHTWQLDIGSAWKMPGTTSIFPSNGTSGGALHSGPEMINFGKVEQISLLFISICLFVYHLWHSLATRHPLEPKNTLFCSHSLIRPGQRIWEIEQLLDNAAYLTCHFKGCLMVVLLKSHSLLTNKTHTLSKWDGVAKPSKNGSFLI